MFADTFRFWHRAVGTSASLCGFLSNGLLLIIVVTSRHPIKQVFIQMIAVDVTLLTMTSICEPLIVFNNGNEFVLQNGYFRHLSQPLNGLLVDIWVFAMYFSICSICVQFIFRYLLLCREKAISGYTLLCFLLIPMTLSIGMGWVFHSGFVTKEGDEEFATQILKNLLLESEEEIVHVSSMSRQGNNYFFYIAVFACTLMSTNYIIILFCVTKIRRRLNILYPLLSLHTRRIHREVSHILFLQAISPLFIGVIPLGYLCYFIFVGGTSFVATIILTMGFSWIPFTNACLTMAIVREFHPTKSNLRKVGSSFKLYSEQTHVDQRGNMRF